MLHITNFNIYHTGLQSDSKETLISTGVPKRKITSDKMLSKDKLMLYFRQSNSISQIYILRLNTKEIIAFKNIEQACYLLCNYVGWQVHSPQWKWIYTLFVYFLRLSQTIWAG